jgi:hypothetical protein
MRTYNLYESKDYSNYEIWCYTKNKGRKTMKNRGHQIDIAAKLIYDLTKELVQTPTTYIKILHSFACRTIETFAEPYCSVEAYKDFYSRTGDDIRKYN